MRNVKTAIVIGSGFGGLGAACLLGKAGYKVTVIEKNEQVGGRASLLIVSQDKNGNWVESLKAGSGDHMQGAAKKHSGAVQASTASEHRSSNAADDANACFKFDMGPSWYLMPDVFEHFFNLLGEDIHKHVDLVRLKPSYRIFYKDLGQQVDIYSDLKKDLPTIEKIEKGAADSLKKYLQTAEAQYAIAKDRFMYKNYNNLGDFLAKEMVTEGRKLQVLKNMDTYVRSYFKTEQIQKIMQYPLVFLGSSPFNTPALYSIMSHIDFNMGVFYPRGGMYELTKALERVAKSFGVEFILNSPVDKIVVENGKSVGVVCGGKETHADIIVSGADIHHTEQALLEPKYRTKTTKYWDKRTLAPSALLMYIGIKGQVSGLTHHNLLFSRDWKQNFDEIFKTPRPQAGWPSDPSMYICAPSKTDPTVAPRGHENLFVLVPIAAGIEYTEQQLETFADSVLETMERHMDLKNLKKKIVYRKLFCVKDFKQRYNSLGGSALGLAHTLKQTAVFRPNNISKKVKNLYFVGAGTNPGIGLPVTLISAELMYKRLIGDKTAGPIKKI